MKKHLETTILQHGLDLYDSYQTLIPGQIFIMNTPKDNTKTANILDKVYKKKPHTIIAIGEVYEQINYFNKIQMTQEEVYSLIKTRYVHEPKHLIAITGSFGKTSTSFFMQQILTQDLHYTTETHTTEENNIKNLTNELKDTPETNSMEENNTHSKTNTKLIPRDVVKIYTAGTYNDETKVENTFLLALWKKHSIYELCYVDVGTNEGHLTEIHEDYILSKIYNIKPAEIIMVIPDPITQHLQCKLSYINNNNFSGAIDVIFTYLQKLNVTTDLINIQKENLSFMQLGNNTISNLEVLTKLLEVLDKTQTAMGKRILRQYLCAPIQDQELINKRLDTIEYFIHLVKTKPYLQFKLPDLNKLLNKLLDTKQSPKEFRVFAEAVHNTINIIQNLSLPPLLQELFIKINKFDTHTFIMTIINEFYELNNSDEYKKITKQQKEILENIYTIPQKYNINGKIKQNNLIGFFIETNLNTKLDSSFILKQGLVNANRYTNAELINLETRLQTLQEDGQNLQEVICAELQTELYKNKLSMEKLFQLMGLIDYYYSCAIQAVAQKYSRPKFTQEALLNIQNFKHPTLSSHKEFITNNITLDHSKRIMIITGPNMGGKSTVLRSVTTIILMAQVGMFIPASHYVAKCFDGLFIRFGAEDNLYEGLSTFKTEMVECSEMIRKATANSFLAFDEIGRGTSTKDGMAIALSIIDYLHEETHALVLLSTHYNDLFEHLNLPMIAPYKMDIILNDQNLEFMYKLIPGISESSFGINVAKNSQFPPIIINKALEYFENL